MMSPSMRSSEFKWSHESHWNTTSPSGVTSWMTESRVIFCRRALAHRAVLIRTFVPAQVAHTRVTTVATAICWSLASRMMIRLDADEVDRLGAGAVLVGVAAIS